MRRKQFCELGPVCYRISLWKEAARKRLRDRRAGVRFAAGRREENLPVIVKGHRSPVLRRLAGVDMALQENKRTNLALAAACIDGVVVEPGESFSFWRLVGPPTARRGYLPGLGHRQRHGPHGGGGRPVPAGQPNPLSGTQQPADGY